MSEVIDNIGFLSQNNTQTQAVQTAAVGSWTNQTAGFTQFWNEVTWSSDLNLFCAISGAGTNTARVMTSSNGTSWTNQTTPNIGSVWSSITWAPGINIFCAVSSSGGGTANRVLTSPDGITWTGRTCAVDIVYNSVTWSPHEGLFCAVASSGSSNRVMTSPDGITWTARTSAADNGWRGVTWSPVLNLFCAVADSGSGNRVMTSPDGITWTIRTSAADNSWRSVAWSSDLGLFCAVANSGSGNRVMTSPDGITWTIRTSAADNDWDSVVWSPEFNLFCAVATTGSGNRIMTSPDGITWSTRSSAADNSWTAVVWSPELSLLCAVSSDGTNRVMTNNADLSAYRNTTTIGSQAITTMNLAGKTINIGTSDTSVLFPAGTAPHLILEKSVEQTGIANDSPTEITWQSILSQGPDISLNPSFTTNTTDVTINKPGLYLLTVSIGNDTPTSAASRFRVSIKLNGLSVLRSSATGGSQGEQILVTRGYLYLQDGDVLDAQARRLGSAGWNIDVGITPQFSIVFVRE